MPSKDEREREKRSEPCLVNEVIFNMQMVSHWWAHNKCPISLKSTIFFYSYLCRWFGQRHFVWLFQMVRRWIDSYTLMSQDWLLSLIFFLSSPKWMNWSTNKILCHTHTHTHTKAPIFAEACIAILSLSMRWIVYSKPFDNNNKTNRNYYKDGVIS